MLCQYRGPVNLEKCRYFAAMPGRKQSIHLSTSISTYLFVTTHYRSDGDGGGGGVVVVEREKDNIVQGD